MDGDDELPLAELVETQAPAPLHLRADEVLHAITGLRRRARRCPTR